MKASHKKEALTFGKLIETVYGVCGSRRARGIMRLAIDAHVVVFPDLRANFRNLHSGSFLVAQR